MPFDCANDFAKEYLSNIRYFCLIMSENYIKNYFDNIKKCASAIESRLDDEWCTMESVKEEMGRELSELSLEELWELFPIRLVAPNDKWKKDYDKIEAFLKATLSEHPIERISHIGNTAISGIWAKDIVDVLIEVSKEIWIIKFGKSGKRNMGF